MRMKLALWAALAALWFAGSAYAQPVSVDGGAVRSDSALFVPGGGTASDGTPKKFRLSSTNAVSTYDEDRDRDKVARWPLFSGTNLAVATADSSGAIDVHAYRYLKLLLKITPRSGANTSVRVALQFRECDNGNVDSTNTYAEYLYGIPPRPMQQDSIAFGVAAGQARLVTFAATDTSAAGHLVTGSATVPWSGEYVITINGNRSSPGNGVASVAWSYPNGISIPLDSFTGRPSRFRYLQVRMRNMNNNNPGVDYSAVLLGFAQ